MPSATGGAALDAPVLAALKGSLDPDRAAQLPGLPLSNATWGTIGSGGSGLPKNIGLRTAAWPAAKDKITEVLSEGVRLIKRAPRYPVYLLARLEHLVVDPGQAIGWRVWAWAKLVKVWGSLCWSDLQAIIPAELSLVEGRLVTTLRRTKTSGPNRRVRELPVAISEYAFFVKRGWLQEGFSLLKQHANYKRDYLMP